MVIRNDQKLWPFYPLLWLDTPTFAGVYYALQAQQAKGKQMTKVEHSLKFVTEFDETHPTAQLFLQLKADSQIAMLESMLKDLLADAIQPVIDTLNERGSYAILKVAN